MTFAVLRSLHAIIGDAISDMERLYANNSPPTSPESSPTTSFYTSSSPNTTPPVSPTTHTPASSPLRPAFSPRNMPSLHTPNFSKPFRSDPKTPPQFFPNTPHLHASHIHPSPREPTSLDFPSLDEPYDMMNPSEPLTTHPEVVSAINHIVAACGQMAATVQAPFLTLCDASMGYHLPSCMRFLEATHTVEILRAAGPSGLHVSQIAQCNGTDMTKLGHILRLLATHHILREVSPNVFANTRISSFMDTGKDVNDILSNVEKKYEGTNGIAAFVGLCTDELFKSSAYLTEAYVLTPHTKHSMLPTEAPFNLAFQTSKQFFNWLEDGDDDVKAQSNADKVDEKWSNNKFRLERFGKAMMGTGAWEAPGAILQASASAGFEWEELSPGSIVVDVGGGIGSTSMLLAEAFEHLTFVIQDRPVVVDMGLAAWKDRCPELLESERVKFQVHDFFTPQPVQNASVYLLRVILHDWPDAFARRILLRLRDAVKDGSDTHLIIADHVLPLACVDDFESSDAGVSVGGTVEGAERMLARPPLLANLGKASANGYWMDLTMQVTFNSQERTLRELVSLCLSAGWKVVKVTRAEGSLFGHIVAVPVPVPQHPRRSRASSSATSGLPRALSSKTLSPIITTAIGSGSGSTLAPALPIGLDEQSIVEASTSRCGTPTFGARVKLPLSGDANAMLARGMAKQRSYATASNRPVPVVRKPPPPPQRTPKAQLSAQPDAKKSMGLTRMRSGSNIRLATPGGRVRSGSIAGSPSLGRLRSGSTAISAKNGYGSTSESVSQTEGPTGDLSGSMA